jgi:hypothetical protein
LPELSAHTVNPRKKVPKRRSSASQSVRRRRRGREEALIARSFNLKQKKTDSSGIPKIFVTRVLVLELKIQGFAGKTRSLGGGFRSESAGPIWGRSMPKIISLSNLFLIA